MRKGTNTSEVLTKLIEFFARFGLPDVIVSDNGPPFNSHTFKSFLQKQGIKVLNSPPYNPASNGQAERLVRTVKDVLKKFLLEPGMLELKLEDQINLFLFNYRNNNLTLEGSFPSEKVFAYTPKMLIDLVNPKKHYKQMLVPHNPNDEAKASQNENTDQTDQLDALMPGDLVWYKHNIPHLREKWIKASFLKRFSKNLLQIMVGNEVATTAHPTQIRLVKDGHGSGQPRRSVRVVETGRSMPATVEPERAPVEGVDVWLLPDRNIDTEDRGQSDGLADRSNREIASDAFGVHRNRKRKFPSESVVPTGLPRRSKRIRKSRLDNEFEYY